MSRAVPLFPFWALGDLLKGELYLLLLLLLLLLQLQLAVLILDLPSRLSGKRMFSLFSVSTLQVGHT
jgi:hypothetical protein